MDTKPPTAGRSDMRDRCHDCEKRGRVCMHIVWSPMCEGCGGDQVYGPEPAPCRRCGQPTRTGIRELTQP